MTAKRGWLNVIYRLPSKPSTLRVNVWKQVKELGGLSLQQSTYAFPDRPEVRVGLAQVRRQVEEGGGEAVLLEVPNLDKPTEEAFIAELVRLRDDEYAEIVEDCEELSHRLVRKTGREHFDREELVDAREDLARIREHFEAISRRDYFGRSEADGAGARLAACEQALAEFAGQVADAREDDSRTDASQEGSAQAKRMREQVRTACDMHDAIAAARRALDDFEHGALTVGSTHVDRGDGTAILELKYSDRNGRRCLEIELEW